MGSIEHIIQNECESRSIFFESFDVENQSNMIILGTSYFTDGKLHKL